jgi:hypothetical protein
MDRPAASPWIQNRNFIISCNVNSLEGRVETTVRESIKVKSKHTFNANTGIQDAVQSLTVESTTTTLEGLLTTTVQRHISYPLTVDFSFVINKEVQRETSSYERSSVPDGRDRKSKWPSPSTMGKLSNDD